MTLAVDTSVVAALGFLYDALIAWTAKRAGATLLTRDRRAVRVYEVLDAPFEIVP